AQRLFGGRFNPIAALMRRKPQNTTLPTFLLTDGRRFSDIVRNPLILEANRMIQRNRLLGTQNAGVFGKILQQFYNK
ncbi:MAG: hypothetical protein II090_03360, partial [Elusimicrobia bacterium]|nr:hypothetical protein [Elusimicrobiota bacterium]